MTGEAVGRQEPVELEGDVPEPMTSLTIPIDNIQYGQSRDIYLRYGNLAAAVKKEAGANPPPAITAVLEYQHFTPTVHQAVAHQSPFVSPPSLDPAEIAHHISRAALVAFLATLSPLNVQSEHEPLGSPPANCAELLQSLVTSLPAANPQFATPAPSHAGCRALLTDICGTAAPDTTTTTDSSTWTGQVAMALLNPTFYHRWGRHYLASLAGAHARQACNSFKDAGPLQYGAHSPLFERCRDRLDKAFDSLPPPVPPVRFRGYGLHNNNYSSTANVPVSMARYNNVGNGCFAAFTPVLLAGGKKVLKIHRLRAGMEVVTPRGPRKVAAVLRVAVRRAEMCYLVAAGPLGRGKRRLLVTPWHPVALHPGGAWVFPRNQRMKTVRYTGAVYSVLLERDEEPDAHAIFVGGLWGVTMGHGLTENVFGRPFDARAHEFYGVYDEVSRALARLPQRPGGVALGGGLTRDPVTGKVNGFNAAKAEDVKALPARQRKRGVYA